MKLEYILCVEEKKVNKKEDTRWFYCAQRVGGCIQRKAVCFSMSFLRESG